MCVDIAYAHILVLGCGLGFLLGNLHSPYENPPVIVPMTIHEWKDVHILES